MSEKPQYTTSQNDFEFFVSECKRFIDLFGLKDWRVWFEHAPGEGGGKPLAECQHHHSARSVIFRLCPDWGGEKPTRAGISQSSYHEVIELLLCPIRSIALDTNIPPTQKRYELDVEAHVIIRRLENAYL